MAAEGTTFAVATPHRKATRAATEAFRDGGSAVDAALAAAAVLTVVYPHACSLGGDLFALVAHPSGEVHAVMSSGAAPASIRADEVRAQHGYHMPERGPETITVPGVVAGWDALAQFGRRGLDRALESAVGLASEGVAVGGSLGRALSAFGDVVSNSRGLSEMLAPNGTLLAEGELFRQPALAGTLKAICDGGAHDFYRGDLARVITDGLRALGSQISPEDLSGLRAEIVPPISCFSLGVEILTCPPNSQGLVLLQLMRAIDRELEEVDRIDPVVLARLARVALLERERFLSDPLFAPFPTGSLIADEHVEDMRRAARDEISPDNSATTIPQPSGDTVAVVAADGEGWCVSLIQSVFSAFGSGLMDPTTGILFQNRGLGFSLDPGSPNVLAGEKRPAHTLTPALARRGERVEIVLGTMGGSAQPQILAQVLLRLLIEHQAPAAAIQNARWAVGGLSPTASRSDVYLESRVPEDTVQAMRDGGFRTVILDAFDERVGHTHVIELQPTGLLRAAADPRSDGSAMALGGETG